MRISRGGFDVRHHLLVRVNTDAGFSGLGEGVGNARLVQVMVENHYGRLLLGADPTHIEQVRRRLLDGEVYYERAGSAICAASALEMACWDIRGKALNAPVHQLLGGMCREQVELYASDVYWQEDAARMAEQAARIVQRGIRTVKAHLGCAPAADESTRLRAMRSSMGAGTRLMVDLNCGYDFAEAARACRLWEEFDLCWLEEPVPPSDWPSMSALRARTSIAVAAGENEFRLSGFRGLVQADAVDVAMPDIGRVGGIQETRNICALTEAVGCRTSLHNFSSGILLAASMHVSAAVPNVELLEFDTSGNAVYEDLLEEPLRVQDGMLPVQQRPGLGVHLPSTVLESYCIHKSSIE